MPECVQGITFHCQKNPEFLAVQASLLFWSCYDVNGNQEALPKEYISATARKLKEHETASRLKMVFLARNGVPVCSVELSVKTYADIMQSMVFNTFEEFHQKITQMKTKLAHERVETLKRS